MKKVIALILAFLMIMSLFSCSKIIEGPDTEEEISSEESDEKNTQSTSGKTDNVFAVGFSRQKYTPASPVNLGGFAGAANRLCDTIRTDVCATCLAIKDTKGSLVLLFSLDLISMGESQVATIADLVSRATGVSTDNIQFCCTHTHEGPASGLSTTQVVQWLKIFYPAILTAAREAIADLDASEIYQNTTEVKNLNFIRRHINKDGTLAGEGDSKENAIGYESEVDDSLQVIKFDRENQKDIVLVNWRAHPEYESGETATVLSADYIHYMRETVEKEGYDCVYFQGACGNIGTKCKLPTSSPLAVPSCIKADEYGTKLAAGVFENLNGEMKKIAPGEVKVMTSKVTLEVDHSEDAKADKAKRVADLINASKITEARALASELGFDSMYHANSVYNKSTLGKTRDMEIRVISIGEAAFVFAPYEMFDISGMEIKDASPFEQTFICELANGSWSYFPAEMCFEKRGYEVCQFRYVKGSAEKIVAEFVRMLTALKG